MAKFWPARGQTAVFVVFVQNRKGWAARTGGNENGFSSICKNSHRFSHSFPAFLYIILPTSSLSSSAGKKQVFIKKSKKLIFKKFWLHLPHKLDWVETSKFRFFIIFYMFLPNYTWIGRLDCLLSISEVQNSCLQNWFL